MHIPLKIWRGICMENKNAKFVRKYLNGEDAITTKPFRNGAV